MQVNVKSTKKSGAIIKFFKGLLALCLMLTLTGILYESISSYIGVKNNLAPGKLIDAGEFKLHLHQQGEGGPTIILEGGSAASSASWGEIPKELSKTATVITYDRGGYAWSDKAKTERTGENIVKELYTVLKKENIEGPYILVGHSLGGMYTRLFAQTYPDEVAGIVLLDARTEDFSKRTEAIFREAGVDELSIGTSNQYVLTVLKLTGVIRVLDHFDALDVNTDENGRMINIELRPKAFQAINEELSYLTQLEDSIRNQALGDIPITIITRGIAIDATPFGLTKEQSDKMEEIWQDEQQKMLRLSTNSKILTAKNSGHAVMDDEPELVVMAIMDMIEEVNSDEKS
ncbi:alpha/beta hydrolase [Bacillus marasmi]|uniref:alpha/beta hydrolase n=1 Tax=Bacillus marasmi TaxID=1926279 RepID=UPI0011CADE91|nr:alpha/beta hydrolase [Bacillus marasmi]